MAIDCHEGQARAECCRAATLGSLPQWGRRQGPKRTRQGVAGAGLSQDPGGDNWWVLGVPGSCSMLTPPSPHGRQGQPDCLCRWGLMKPALRRTASAKTTAMGSISLPMAGGKGSPSPAGRQAGEGLAVFLFDFPCGLSAGVIPPLETLGVRHRLAVEVVPGVVLRWAPPAAPRSHPPPAPAECLGWRSEMGRQHERP